MKKFIWNRSKCFQELKFYQHTRLVIWYFCKFLWSLRGQNLEIFENPDKIVLGCVY